MRPRNVYLILAVSVIAAGYVVMRVENYYEARRWHIEVKVRAPVYEKPIYPYGTQSPPNPVVGYLEVGAKPDLRSVDYDKDYPYWEVRLESGKRGYLFMPDVQASPRREP